MPDADAVTHEVLLQQGKPFHIIMTIPANDVSLHEFYLNTDNYDVGGPHTQPYFADRPADWRGKPLMLWVGAMIIVATNQFSRQSPSMTSQPVLRFDNILVWDGALPIFQAPLVGQCLDLAGEGYLWNDGVGVVYKPTVANIETKYGVKFLPIRTKFSLQLQDIADHEEVQLEMWGVYTPRTY